MSPNGVGRATSRSMPATQCRRGTSRSTQPGPEFGCLAIPAMLVEPAVADRCSERLCVSVDAHQLATVVGPPDRVALRAFDGLLIERTGPVELDVDALGRRAVLRSLVRRRIVDDHADEFAAERLSRAVDGAGERGAVLESTDGDNLPLGAGDGPRHDLQGLVVAVVGKVEPFRAA